MTERYAGAAGPSDARSLLHAVDVAVADAETDLDVVLLQPTLLDPRHPAAARFAAERTRVRRLVAADPESWTAQAAATDLAAAWHALRDEARATGLRDRPWRERRRVRRARRLLEEARSDRGSPAIRLRAYRRGLRLLDGVVVVPEPLLRELHAAAAVVPPLRTPGPDFPTYG